MESNYEKQVYIARELFLGYDQQPLIEKFDLKWDEKFLYTEFLRVSYRIDRKTGEIQEEKEGEETGWEPCLDYNVVMTIYDMLCHSEERPPAFRGVDHPGQSAGDGQQSFPGPVYRSYGKKTGRAAGKTETGSGKAGRDTPVCPCQRGRLL